MVLINTLNGIGDAIREKTGSTDLIPLKEMADAIKNIVSGDYNSGYADGVASVQNPLEYATQLYNAYYGAVFPANYEIEINVPVATQMGYAFWSAVGVKKVKIKGNINGNAVSFRHCFRSCTDLEIIDLTEYNVKISDGTYAFTGSQKLKQIVGIMDLTECTAVGSMFNNCYALEEVRFKKETISLSISFAYSSLLSAESVQSIIDGLATVETAQTLTFNAAITLTDEQKAQISSKNWTLVQ